MTEQVKIGMVGTSWWADLMFLPILAGYERISLAAICGRNRERAEEMAAKYNIPQVFTDYRQMMTEGNLDAVIVATPDDTHYEITMAALEAGLHVLCDKPVALNAQHAKAMYDKAEAAGVKHMVMFTWHWMPAIKRAKQMVDAGYIGKAYHGNFRYLAGYGRSKDYLWRFDAERANGALGDLGAHGIHLAQWLLGEVVSVSAQLGFHVERESPDGKIMHNANDSAWLILEHANGACTQIALSATLHTIDGDKTDILVTGDKGSIEAGWAIGENTHNFIHASQEGSDEIIGDDLPLNFFHFFQNEPVGPRKFADAILDDKPIYPGLYEGYKVQQVIDAALQSHETGRRVGITP